MCRVVGATLELATQLILTQQTAPAGSTTVLQDVERCRPRAHAATSRSPRLAVVGATLLLDVDCEV